MKEKELWKQYEVEYQMLLEYGFEKEKDYYILKKDLNFDLYTAFIWKEKTLKIDVYEKATGEKYIPFYIKNAEGVYVNEIKEKIDIIKKEYMEACLKNFNIKEQILEYVKKKHHAILEHPWDKFPNYVTLKTRKKKKWYGVIMEISAEKLGLINEEVVGAMNLKNEPNKIQTMIDDKTIFPAYHMNKKYWFTVLLNEETNLEKLKQLIDESYYFVEK